jgi:hypothetical protein
MTLAWAIRLGDLCIGGGRKRDANGNNNGKASGFHASPDPSSMPTLVAPVGRKDRTACCTETGTLSPRQVCSSHAITRDLRAGTMADYSENLPFETYHRSSRNTNHEYDRAFVQRGNIAFVRARLGQGVPLAYGCAKEGCAVAYPTGPARNQTRTARGTCSHAKVRKMMGCPPKCRLVLGPAPGGELGVRQREVFSIRSASSNE